jgi:hypothetical protein
MSNAENTFHLSEKVNRHNVHTETSHVVIEHERDSPKVNVFCAISHTRITDPFFFAENTMRGTTYMNMLTEWVFPQLQEDSDTSFCSKTGHCLTSTAISGGSSMKIWIGRSIQNIDLPLEERPPWSPNITPYDFFLWGYVKNLVFVQFFSRNVKKMKESILGAVSAIDSDTLQRVWDGWRVTCDTRSLY